jgi:hypothetical protein
MTYDDIGGEEELTPEVLREFLAGYVANDPFAKQALADAIAVGMLPRDPDTDLVTFTLAGLEWMKWREQQLRIEAN